MQRFLKFSPLLALLLVYISGLFIPIMEVDAAQYSSISLEMFKTGNFLEIYHRGENYLDKPPLLFWLCTISYNIFGIGTWQYKLPSMLFSILGIFSIYKLGDLLYTKTTGKYAALIFGSSLALTIINNDIKTDTILISSIAFSTWMCIAFIRTNRWKYAIGISVGISISMLAKGPIGLMVPTLAIFGHSILKKDWKALISIKWLPIIGLIIIFLTPMCIGLYKQHGLKGIQFYFWTQSFGRITGESSWKNDTSFFYFSHVFLWSFAPWSLLAIIAIITEIKQNISKRSAEVYCLCGILLVSFALSLSKFKLPHYIFVVYPFTSILTAKYILHIRSFSFLPWIQLILVSLTSILFVHALIWCFPSGGLLIPILISILFVLSLFCFFIFRGSKQIILPSFIISIAIGLGLNLHFYPELLKFQANSQAGKWITKQQISKDKLIGFASGGHALDFYSQRIVPWISSDSIIKKKIKPGVIVYADNLQYDRLMSQNLIPKDTISFKNFEVQNLSIPFLNPNTRKNVIKKNYLLFY